jgi:cell division septum initiation protein DivIVA
MNNPIAVVKVTFSDGRVERYNRHYMKQFLDFVKWLIENKVQENISKIEIES